MQFFVKILNRDKYTNPKRAEQFVLRGLAEVVTTTETGLITEIRMLEGADLEAAKRVLKMSRPEYDPVKGKFEWFVGDSGGSQLMLQYEGVSGGMRVYQAVHGS